MSSTIRALEDLLSDDAGAGAKATVLARLRAAGHPVADGVVLLPGSEATGALAAAARGLGDRFVVRSSSAGEDTAAAAAPGIFESFLDVALDDLAHHAERVRDSARGERARAYAAATGQPFPAPMAVLVQPYLEPSVRGTLYTRRSAESDAFVLEAVPEATRGDERPTRIAAERDAPPPAFPLLSEALLAELFERAAAIEALAFDERGADIEWLVHDGALWIVQARALTRPPHEEPTPPPPEAFDFALVDEMVTWRWDVAHNPEPLSFAQRGLVELVGATLGARLALAEGYLYEAVDEPIDEPIDEQQEQPVDLEALFFADLAPRLDALLDPLEADDAPDIERALSVFVAINRAYSLELRPVLSAARRRASPSVGLGVGGALLAAIASGHHGFGEAARRYAGPRAALGERWYWEPYATAWDVASPCFEERPDELDDLVRALEGRAAIDASTTAIDNLVYAVSELDDRFFYRAQRLVRRAVLGLPGEPMAALRFDLPLDALRQWGGRDAPPDNADEQATSNRRDRLEAATLTMPLFVRGAHHEMEAPRGDGSAALTGSGSGGKARGRVTFGGPAAGRVLVAGDLTPGEILHAVGAAAIVLERGLQLGHASALARELGVPIITSVKDATRVLRQDEPIWLDASAGLIIRLTSSGYVRPDAPARAD